MSPIWVQTIRDVAIIILALESIAIGLLLVILVLQVQKLVKVLEQEIKPLLASANETFGTVRGTTNFVSKSLVSPTIKIWSYGAAVRQVAQIIFGRRGGAKKP